MDGKLLSVIPAVLLALTHVILHTVEISIENKDGWHWLSFLAGVTTAYVFLGLIPDIDKYKYALVEATEFASSLDKRFYAVLILIGFTYFLSMDSTVRHSRKRKTLDMDDDIEFANTPILDMLPCENKPVFLFHIVTYTLYGFVISMLLPIKFKVYGQVNMWFYYIAMQSLYIIDDMSLHDNFREWYDRYGRIPLIIGTIVGYIFGYFVEISITVVAGIASLIAGATIYTALSTELPANTKASVPLFIAGVLLYGVCITFLLNL